MSAPYQLLPPLSDDERAALHESIETFGILQPVIVDEVGNIIDGHHRAEFAAELGIDCPRVTVPGLTEEQKLEQALVLNMARRHLDAEQRQALVADLRSRGLSLRWISDRTGIPRSTVHRLVERVPGGTPEYVGGLDGRRYRARRPMVTDADLAARYRRELLEAGLPEEAIGPLTTEELSADLAMFGWDPPHDREALRASLHTMIASLAAKVTLRGGRVPRRPEWLDPPDWADVPAVNREKAFYMMVAREGGGFINWYAKHSGDDDPIARWTIYTWLGTDAEQSDPRPSLTRPRSRIARLMEASA